MNRRKLSKDDRLIIYHKCNGHCAYCGTPIEYSQMQADHIIPLHNGGKDELDNMLPACRSCNHYKSTLTLEKFRYALERQPEVLMRDNATYKIAVRYGTVKPNIHKIVFYFEQLSDESNLIEE